MAMECPSGHLGEPRHAGFEKVFHMVRSYPPRRVAQADLGILAQRHQTFEQIQGCRFRHTTAERAIEGGRDIQPYCDIGRNGGEQAFILRDHSKG